MLDVTQGMEFRPGTNLSGDLACADWRFLLPRFDLRDVLILGTPPASSLQVLARFARKLIIASNDVQRLRSSPAVGYAAGVPNARIVAAKAYSHLPLPSQSMDLIWVTAGPDSPPLDLPLLSCELERLLHPEGAVYFESQGWIKSLQASRLLRRFRSPWFGPPQIYCLTPHRGEMRTAVPFGDKAIAHYFFGNVLFGLSAKTRSLSRIGDLFVRLGLWRFLAWRRGVVVRLSSPEASCPVPRSLVSLARSAGYDLSPYRLGFSARGRYNANKVIFYLFGSSDTEPEVVVKMTRSPEFNPRLEHESRVLSLLRDRALAEPGTFPEQLFFGHQAGRAALALRGVGGRPFRTVTRATADCPFAQKAIDWITTLGARSADTKTATPSEVATVLAKLFERFSAIYSLSDSEAIFLQQQIRRLAAARGAFPVVCQHGDPGTWNLLVGPAGQVIFLDWEAGESQGMPLWDLFYFVKSFATWMQRRKGVRGVEESFARNFLRPSPASELLSAATGRYCQRIRLETSLVEPLFYTCWMHRALKEATRLSTDLLPQGEYMRLLRLCIQRRDALRATLPVLGDSRPASQRDFARGASSTPFTGDASADRPRPIPS